MTNCNFGSLSYWRKNNLNGREVVFDQRGILHCIQMYCINERKGKFKLGTFDLLIFLNSILHFIYIRVFWYIHIDMHINRLFHNCQLSPLFERPIWSVDTFLYLTSVWNLNEQFKLIKSKQMEYVHFIFKPFSVIFEF